jgi:DNA (cytosine-5)-methyltransferase 1
VVSGRKNTNGYVSIIDLASADLIDVTNGAKKVRADFYENQIIISIHHLDKKQLERESRLIKSLKNGFVKKAEVCVGIGVSCAAVHDGFKDMGIKARTEFIVDRERRYLDVAKKNCHAIDEATTIFESSLEEVEVELLGFVDVLGVTLDCSPHGGGSRAKTGNKIAEEHEKSALGIIGAIKVIDACQPSVIYSENILGAKDSASYLLLKGMLKLQGYNVNEVVLDSKNTGSIENRKRWWMVCTSLGLPEVNLNNFPEFPRQFNTLSDLLEKNIPESMWKSTDEKVRKAAENKENGKNFGFNLIDGSAKSIGVCGKSYQKNRSSEPHIKGLNNTARLLTVKELCLAQSSPLNLVNGIPNSEAYEGLGQSIDYRQGVGIGRIIARDVFSNFIDLKFNTEIVAPEKIEPETEIQIEMSHLIAPEKSQISLF